MNRRALQYTNQIRHFAGKPSLSMGSVAMLKNAHMHNEAMSRYGGLYHQPIGQGVYVGSGGCHAMLTAENVAQNTYEKGSDAAQLCVLQWRDSHAHYDNIVADNRNVVVAVWVDQNSKIWCTQVFSKTPATIGGGECAFASSGSNDAVPFEQPSSVMNNEEAYVLNFCYRGFCLYCTKDKTNCRWES